MKRVYAATKIREMAETAQKLEASLKLSVQEPIGYQRTYETMVWRILPDGDTSAESIDFAPYNTPEDADAGHARLVRKWAHVAKRRAKP